MKITGGWADDLNMLYRNGYAKAAYDLTALLEEDAPNKADVNYKSFTTMVELMVTDGDYMLPMKSPRFGITHDGFVEARWDVKECSSTMRCIPSGRVLFFAAAGDDGTNMSVVTNKFDALEYMRLFWMQHLPLADRRGRRTVSGSKTTTNAAAELDALRSNGQLDMATNLAHMVNEANVRHLRIDAKSISHMARFVVKNRKCLLPGASLGTDPYGFVKAYWMVFECTFTMTFLPSGNVKFAAVARNKCVFQMSGSAPPDEVMRHMRLLWKRYVPGYTIA